MTDTKESDNRNESAEDPGNFRALTQRLEALRTKAQAEGNIAPPRFPGKVCHLSLAPINLVRNDATGLCEAQYDDDASSCPLCAGLGYNRLQVDESEQGPVYGIRPCRGRIKLDKRALYTKARIPGKYLSASLENIDFQVHTAVNASIAALCLSACNCGVYGDDIREAAREQFGRGVYIWGPNGPGKTWALCAAARALTTQHGIPTRFYTVGALLNDVRATYRDKSGASESSIKAQLAEWPVLILDEVGKQERSKALEVSLLAELLDERISKRRVTWLSSNWHPDELQNLLGKDAGWDLEFAMKRFVSRVHESCEIVELRGPDRRKRNG